MTTPSLDSTPVLFDSRIHAAIYAPRIRRDSECKGPPGSGPLPWGARTGREPVAPDGDLARVRRKASAPARFAGQLTFLNGSPKAGPRLSFRKFRGAGRAATARAANGRRQNPPDIRCGNKILRTNLLPSQRPWRQMVQRNRGQRTPTCFQASPTALASALEDP